MSAPDRPVGRRVSNALPDLGVWRVLVDDDGWMAGGACRVERVPTARFFPGDDRAAFGAAARAAKQVCARCGVRDDCLAYALGRPTSPR